MSKRIRSLRLSTRTWSQLEDLARWHQVDDRTKVIELLTEQEYRKMADMNISERKVTVSMTWERLAAMDDWGQRLWATPGADKPYWASNANFMYDECVATVHDFEYDGIEYSRDPEGWEGNEILTAEVELLEPRG